MNALNFVPVWTVILGAGIFFYVLLDGFDLGVGMLYGFMPDTRSRNMVMNAIAPVWDGNETWLVLGGVALLAAFPLAFAIIIPALYFPTLVMLLALVFRGVAFEFRFRDAEHKTFWDQGFFYGSMIATVAQGMMLGAFIHWHRPGLRLWAPGHRLAGAQDRGRHPGAGAPLWPYLPGGRGDRDFAGQHLDAADERCSVQALVLLAEHPRSVTGADRDRSRRRGHVAGA
jgi:hypothetical protein